MPSKLPRCSDSGPNNGNWDGNWGMIRLNYVPTLTHDCIMFMYVYVSPLILFHSNNGGEEWEAVSGHALSLIIRSVSVSVPELVSVSVCKSRRVPAVGSNPT